MTSPSSRRHLLAWPSTINIVRDPKGRSNRTQETEMDCLQLAAIFCCVAIGNGNVLKRALLGPAVCVYGKQLTFIQLTRHGRWLLMSARRHHRHWDDGELKHIICSTEQRSPYLTCWRYGLQFRLLSVMNTTRRYVWKNRDDINLLINGSRYLSHALVNLSAFVNVLSYEFRHVRTGWTKSPSDLGRSFNRCRDIALDG